MAPDLLTAVGTGQERLRRKGMAKIHQPWSCAPRRMGKSSGSEQSYKRVGDGRAMQSTPPQRHEQMIIGCRQLGTLGEITLQGSTGGGVEWHQTAFVELRLANHEPIGGHIGKTQAERLRNPYSCRGQ